MLTRKIIYSSSGINGEPTPQLGFQWVVDQITATTEETPQIGGVETTMKSHSDESPKGNILVVDDIPDNLRFLSSILKKQGYCVRKALNGYLALIACEAVPPDALLLDINMPDMNGYEVCAALKANQHTRDIPVIFISVLDDVLDKVKAFSVGGVDYITKPFHPEEVVARLENQLTLKRLQSKLEEQNCLLEEKNWLLEEQNAQLLREISKRQDVEKALQQANEKLQALACIDNVTGVANRHHFEDSLQREWQRSAREKLPISLILCDIDYFKTYNDTYGHLAGDTCLKQVARAIAHEVKRPTDLVARYGGEEFAVILPNTNFRGAVRVAQNIQLAVQRLRIIHLGSSVSDFLTLSLGIASIVPCDRQSPKVAIALADKALYRAKEQGRNRYCTDMSPSQNTG